MSTHLLKSRVYYEDTDSSGFVYHANYLKFMERARTEWLYQLGFNIEELQQQGIFFVVHSLQINYIKPARLAEELEVISHIDKLGYASLIYQQKVQRLAGKQLLCEGIIKVACLNAERKPCALPAEMSSCFSIRKVTEEICLTE